MLRLQEWAVCCNSLLRGDIILMVRKGGIHERHGGLFTLEHRRFALLPTFLHQEEHRLSTAFQGRPFADAAGNPDPDRIHVSGFAEAEHIWKATDLAKIQALGGELLWSADELASRFHYRSQPWLYVIALRVHRLASPQTIADHPSYAGCRSWIPLKEAVDCTGSPVLPAARFEERVQRIDSILR
jgi:hypothetical protein